MTRDLHAMRHTHDTDDSLTLGSRGARLARRRGAPRGRRARGSLNHNQCMNLL